jgi:hypothetical protein
MPEEKQQLEGGAYEVIRDRLSRHGAELRDRLESLNAERKALFGVVENELISTSRVTTEFNCVPRDMISVGANRFLFGYNIQFGLKQTTSISDVFAAYEYNPEGHEFQQLPIDGVLTDEFAEDFQYLYRYYKQTVFVKFMVIGPHLFMGMRIGKGVDDLKTFKWLMQGDGTLQYLGNRFDHEYVFPNQQEFEWKRAHRDMHRSGEHPHISIADRVFVETVGGDLTIKIEDNTTTGEGIYAEPVADLDQTLDDAEIFYALVGPLILMKILPYREDLHRYLVYNEKTRMVHRLDAIGQSCVLLPDDQGLIFANGYLLLTGEVKVFGTDLTNMRFERRILSANGEDFLHVFYNRVSGDYVLLSYNIISQTVETPVICNGYSLFPNGELVFFKTAQQAQKHHILQVWQTPYLSEEALAAETGSHDSMIFKIGNAELVRGMAECREVLVLLGKEDSYAGLYLDLVKKTGDVLDSYFWIAKKETHDLAHPVREIQRAAGSAIDEFDKVQRLRQGTKEQTGTVREAVEALLKQVAHSAPDDILGFVHHLTEMRRRRGEVIGLRELRYVDKALVEDLEQRVIEATERCSNQTVEFLLKEEALVPYRKAVEEQKTAIGKLGKVTEADAVGEALDNAGAELEMLIDVVSNLKIEDATKTTAIIDGISTIYATLNGVRAELKQSRRELAKSEGVAQFGAQMKLLSQAVVNYLDLCDSPERCDEYLTKLMVQVEELEGRFAEFDEDIEELGGKREEIYEAFEGRKQSLLEQRNRRAGTLVKSAERILSGVQHRVSKLEDINDINGYFAGDLMIDKLRDIIAQLGELGDSVKADDVQTRLNTLRDDSVRQLKDRKELFVDGGAVIQFGRHKFSVNEQELELSIIPHDDKMCFHLSGTDFFEPVRNEEFLATREIWGQEIISENADVYRAEWLVYQMLVAEEVGNGTIEDVQRFMQPRYAEGYTKGVHDADAAKLLAALLPIHREVGLLRYAPATRGAAITAWHAWAEDERSALAAKLAAHAGRRKFLGASEGEHELVGELESALGSFLEVHFPAVMAKRAAEYLFGELTGSSGFVVSREAAGLMQHFQHVLAAKRAKKTYEDALAPFAGDALGRFQVNRDWLDGLDDGPEYSFPDPVLRSWYVSEAAAHLARGDQAKREVHAVTLETSVEGLSGSHSRIEERKLSLHYNEFFERLDRFALEAAPKFKACQEIKKAIVEEKRGEIRLEEFQPRVLSSFVRNRLINDVYLPLVGDNLSKQMGTAGVDSRTDRMGMLLLISPPGYGKTTLMEYIANRLGLTFLKINGPAIGHHVTSLDPAEAPNLSAREEIEKLNLGLEMGDNLMLYVDDIQHCNPEFLQKFISLCDAQRKIEGVYKGRARTYDLRGKKVAVVMAGNPFTESGSRFQIPDMLANRADTYNLGDILGGHEEAFKGSYIENCLTSNPALQKLASRSQADVYAAMRIAESGAQEGIDFEGNYTPAEIEEFAKTLKHLFAVRDSLLRVNQEYIHSAGQEDAYRTEPAFRLQGSYRNMNRIAEKVVPLMTEEEVRELVSDHYRNESQTLTTGAEANLLKFFELEGTLTEEDSARWDEIKVSFRKKKLLGGAGEQDPVARVVAQLSEFNDGLGAIKEGIAVAGADYAKPQTLAKDTVSQLQTIIEGLRAVPVKVDINIVPVQDQGDSPIESIEKTSKKKAAKKKQVKKPLIDIEPEVSQGD